ncbi:tyrosine-type recombinase/integrase [Maridesulfovibrio ferrireducens]|uniref:tyrosine-type recombinase/integrase n=1 Tax=Maridesulfovibrio ferrireducens TaxID=246191 RepID=UPI001A279914|nr:tyrosine-type recombinase/integrase [Maridesulfovibrio ferrireducens]MBI9110340.1 tyrosine-type recombinase/integrase [Maridesulfovibrio ferrireducens]
MEKRNPNHPEKGSSTKVDPITSLEDIANLKKLLAENPRDLALFVLGINTNLRAVDLVQLRVDQFVDAKVGDELVLRESKTGKERRITLSPTVLDAVRPWAAQCRSLEVEYLFTGRNDAPMAPNYVNKLVKKWCSKINLKGNYGSHTLRKTFGYQQRVVYDVEISKLMETFNHSSPRQTLTYLCIQPEEIRDIYMNPI